MYQRQGGVTDLQIIKEGPDQTWTLFVLIDVQDSMGANTINTVLEGLAKKV